MKRSAVVVKISMMGAKNIVAPVGLLSEKHRNRNKGFSILGEFMCTARRKSLGLTGCGRRRAAACLALAGLGLLAGLLGACASPSPREAADYGARRLETGPAALALAALVIEHEPDTANKTFLYARLARQYYLAGKVDLGAEILRRSLVKIRAVPAASRHSLMISLGSTLIQLGYRNQGRDLMKEAYGLIVAIPDDKTRGWALGELIQACFRYPEDLGAILREAVDHVFVLDDRELKVQILTDIAFKYQELNSQGRVSTMIQHVVIAALGIEDPWFRAEAFARIAKAWKTEGDNEEAERWVEKTLAVLVRADVAGLTEAGQMKFLETLLRLADFNRFRELGTEVARLPDADARLSVQLAVIGAYLKQGATGVFQARLAVQRLLNTAAQEEAAGLAGAENRAALMLVRLAELYQGAGQKAEALQYADAAALYLERHGLLDRNPLRSRLAEMYALAGEHTRALVQVNLVQDAWVAAKTGVRLLDILADRTVAGQAGGAGWPGLDALLAGTLQRAQETTTLRDSVLAGLVSASWRLDRLEVTVESLLLVNEPFALAGTLMDTWQAGESGKGAYAAVLRRLELAWGNRL